MHYLNGSLTLLLLFFATANNATDTIKAAVLKNENFQERYSEILSGKSPLDINNFTPKSHGSHLEIIEMIILQQALNFGGLEEKVVFEPLDIANLGEISSVVDGSILMYGRSMWMQTSADYQGSLYISDPVIEYGKFEAGLYFNSIKQDIGNTPLIELDRLKVISNPRWKADWRALINSPMTIQSFIGPWENMLAMVDARIVDVMLINFSVSRDLNLNFKGNHYKPIHGVKVILPDSRHFVVSKKHPEGEKVFKALQKGLKVMREKGRIQKFYEQAGVFNHLVKGWTIINKEMLDLP